MWSFTNITYLQWISFICDTIGLIFITSTVTTATTQWKIEKKKHIQFEFGSLPLLAPQRFQLYYLVKENPLEIITYIWILILDFISNDILCVVWTVLLLLFVFLFVSAIFCYCDKFNVELKRYHCSSLIVWRSHTRLCESTKKKQNKSKRKKCVIKFLPFLNRNWCTDTDNRIAFSVDNDLDVFFAFLVSFLLTLTQYIFVIIVMLNTMG